MQVPKFTCMFYLLIPLKSEASQCILSNQSEAPILIWLIIRENKI